MECVAATYSMASAAPHGAPTGKGAKEGGGRAKETGLKVTAKKVRAAAFSRAVEPARRPTPSPLALAAGGGVFRVVRAGERGGWRVLGG